MQGWQDQPDAEGWWDVDVVGCPNVPAVYVHGQEDRGFVVWLPQKLFYGDTERTGDIMVDTDHSKLLTWWWKRVLIPDLCPNFDAKDDPA